MKIRWLILISFISLFLAFQVFGACSKGDDDDSGDDDTGDDDTANDDVTDDDVTDDDVADDDAADDDVTDDDLADDDVTDDDVTDDDTTPADDDTVAAPTYPNNHSATWNCYLCHSNNFLGVTTPEPHGHAYTAPDQCVGCHQEGAWTNPPYHGGHNWNQNCLGCHGNHHGKNWQDKNQCLVCHGPGR